MGWEGVCEEEMDMEENGGGREERRGEEKKRRTTMPRPIIGTSSPIQILFLVGSEPGLTIWMESLILVSVGSLALGMDFLVSSLECGWEDFVVVVLVMIFVPLGEVVVLVLVVLVGVGSGLVLGVEVGESDSVGFGDDFDGDEDGENSFLKEGAMMMLREVRLCF